MSSDSDVGAQVTIKSGTASRTPLYDVAGLREEEGVRCVMKVRFSDLSSHEGTFGSVAYFREHASAGLKRAFAEAGAERHMFGIKSTGRGPHTYVVGQPSTIEEVTEADF